MKIVASDMSKELIKPPAKIKSGASKKRYTQNSPSSNKEKFIRREKDNSMFSNKHDDANDSI